MLNENLLSPRMKNDGKANIYLNEVQQTALQLFKKGIEAGEYDFEHYDCDCGTPYEDLITIAKKDRYGLAIDTKICPKCGLLMTNPRMTQESYNKFYDTFYRKIYVGRPYAGEEYYTAQQSRGKRIYEYIMKEGGGYINDVLEIGCSSGGILSIFNQHGIKCKGVDLGSEYIAYGQSKGLDLENCSSERLLSENKKYDLIILNHVLEHFLDIKKELHIIRELLTEDGLLYVGVPGIKSIHITYFDILNYLQNAHVRHFSRNTLIQLMSWNGFKELNGNENIQSLYKKSDYINDVHNYSSDIMDYLKKLSSLIDDHKISKYLEDRGIKNVAIYGFGVMGKRVYNELRLSQKIKINYLIDRKDMTVDNMLVYKPNRKLPKVDLVIIATFSDYNNIKESIGDNSPIITIKEIIEKIIS